jgi:Lrp/AsnC family transcriptional regulator for asnA, asnC and gidA|tara:strand:+ start:508 stop:969 length:462 start_codon:yes stop_codon:yes gene_type:complete
MLDKKDRIILNELQTDADRKIYQLEKSTLLPRSTIHNRIKRLKRDGVIQKIKAVVDPRELDLNVTALVHIIVTFKKGARTIAERISKLDNVEEVHLTAGEFDIIAKVRFHSNKDISNFIFGEKGGLKCWEGIERTESMICVDTVKENGILKGK